ncbi:MAG: hypothetical protein HS113_15890 [Verrucomicrobiales bacterium]|nr:hypothetical protein [Verrucomicrobiales bacterium]
MPSGPVVGFPGPWQFQFPKGAIILVSDQQLEELTDPDREVDLSLSRTPNRTTLRRLCEQQRAAGARTIILAFDEFWSQYRPGQGGQPRQLTPDTEAYVARIARISATLKQYGLGLELSLLSPLEIGAGYVRQTGESGRWVQYREGWRDPKTGRYTLALWEPLRWTNNKGTIELERAGVRAFAFRERRLGRTSFYAVAPGDIVELKTPPQLEAAETATRKHRRLTVRGEGDTDAGPSDRVLVVMSYRVPEMDYFSPQALPFLEALVRRYHTAGIPLNGLYADEMHIQQDWGYADHHEEGQFALRYLTPHLAATFARLYGTEYADFERRLVYFAYGQHGFLPDLQARLAAQHVLGPDPADVQRTFLLRRRYYELLHNTVVELFARAKASAEQLYGHELEARAHATWAQSPTIDFWNVRNQPLPPRQYEYTSDFLWSNTIQQAASACSDYFKWNEFLTGGGNDHAEGGWSDRNYYGLALACSTGSLNRVPNAYAAAWGMPAAVHRRHRALENAFGCAPDDAFAAVTDYEHREVPVLMLYPSSLVACEERFGSWMVQYGYANYVTPAKLLEHGRLLEGQLDLAGRRYGTIAVLFEPLPPPGLLDLLERFVEAGGKLIWSGPPPQFDLAGADVRARWQRLFGVRSLGFAHEGLVAAGGSAMFEGALGRVPAQVILTDFLVDLIYPFEPEPGGAVVARVGARAVGVHRSLPRDGSTTFLGFRPRDDQAGSLGVPVQTWFEILRALGSYSGEDDPSVVSRTSRWLATRFPNGALAVGVHYRDHVESWPGGFHRDTQQDEQALAANPLPPDELELTGLRLAGRRVDFRGRLLVAFREDDRYRLAAFAGYEAQQLRLDGREHVFADRPMPMLGWAPVRADRRVVGGAMLEVWVQGEGRLRLPLSEGVVAPRLFAASQRPGTLGAAVPARVEGGILEFEAGPGKAQGKLFLLPA